MSLSNEEIIRSDDVFMKSKVIKVAITILVGVILLGGVFTYVNKDVIFQRGNPIPYLKKAVFLSEKEHYKKVFDNKEIYISKGRGYYNIAEESLIKLAENKYNATFIEQAGSGYIFQSEDQRIIMSTEVYLKYYNVWEISAEQKEALYDLIPLVKIKGKLYLDTGKESDIGARCGVMDGEINSTVEPFEKPAQDNQSNFGTGYGYQFTDDNGIDIYMNGKWIRFEKEKE